MANKKRGRCLRTGLPAREELRFNERLPAPVSEGEPVGLSSHALHSSIRVECCKYAYRKFRSSGTTTRTRHQFLGRKSCHLVRYLSSRSAESDRSSFRTSHARARWRLPSSSCRCCRSRI